MPTPLPAIYELQQPMTRAEVLEALRSIPERVSAALTGVTPARLATPPAPNEWSAFQTLSHMRDAAMVYSGRFRWMAMDPDPFMPNFQEDAWAANTLDRPEDAAEMVDEYRAERAALVRLLSRLPEAAWQRTGRHEVLGSLVLEPYVRHQLQHELWHVEQLEAALATPHGA
jgi:hypothetical protein